MENDRDIEQAGSGNKRDNLARRRMVVVSSVKCTGL